MDTTLDLVAYSLEAGEAILSRRSKVHRKEHGQFLTPAPVARFMAGQLGLIRNGARILDPAIGSGTLVCAVVERLMLEDRPAEIWIEGYETDQELIQAARGTLQLAIDYAAQQGIKVHAHLYEDDLILSAPSFPRLPSLFVDEPYRPCRYDHIIANPPYFKLNAHDPRVKAVEGWLKGHTNIYTLFMALAARMLTEQGKACFIVPRSFCSGAYFSAFRRDFMSENVPEHIHLFESREETFKDEAILQENIIVTFKRRRPDEQQASIRLSASKNGDELSDNRLKSRDVPIRYFLGKQAGAFFFRLPMGELDEALLDVVDSWSGSLGQYGLRVSTGPVVPFRAKALLVNDLEAVAQGKAVPLLWMHNVMSQRIAWPAENGGKPQAIRFTQEAMPLLIPADNIVVIRRFSAKEEQRRLVAAPLLTDQIACQWIGLENHLNYIYRQRGQLEPDEAAGLSALLNSALIDRYVRILSGNTQINAAELRALPLPPLEIIRQIGKQIVTASAHQPIDIDLVVHTTLWEAGQLATGFPLLRETRITMGKIQEAQEILKALGLPAAQQNEMSALTLLVLAQLSEETPWDEARTQSLRIHDVLLGIKERYGREYAENTRETIRRQVIHQLEQASIVLRNPDEPSLPVNSPRTHYVLSDAVVQAIRRYGSKDWQRAVQAFLDRQGALLEVYQRSREQHKVPLRLASGEIYYLSPGKHNELQVAIVEEFGPRFAPGARLLYIGDAANKTLILDEVGFDTLGVPRTSHDKLPDVVLHDEARNRLFLIEAATSHGPITPKRQVELKEIFGRCAATCIYVSAFPDFATFKGFLTEVAWETEVWLAEIPDHLIHFNGDRFLGSSS